MMRLARVILTVLLASAGWGGASAQSLDRVFQGIERHGQPPRAAIRAEWEKISAGEILCVDDRLRRARRSVNLLIDRGIGPTDTRISGIVSDCRTGADPDRSSLAATPSFNCRAATQPDEMAICATPELARLDRAVVEGYERMVGSDGGAAAKSVAEPFLRRRHACGAEVDCIKGVQLMAIAAFQARGAPAQVPAPAQGAGRDNAAYSVAGILLGSSVGVGSADYRDYTCAPARQYAGFTGCLRQTVERSRRRRVMESTSFLHAADGSAVYINQNLDPVALDENDARDEISRLSETLGKATVFPTQSARGVPSGLIAAWGAVSLQPLDPGRTAELAEGTGDKPGILVDTIGNPQRSAQLGLPVYRLGGGAGYVWSASWNGRGRGALRMLAIDASRLSGSAEEAKPLAEPGAVVSAAAAPTAVTVAPPSPTPDGPKPTPATQPTSAAAQPAQKPVEPAPGAAPQVKTPAASAAPPSEVRVVGPPIALRPTAATPAATGARGGNGLGIFFSAVTLFLVIAAVGYLLRKSRVAPPADAAAPAALMIATPAPVTSAVPVASKAEKMDLTALIPTGSPASVSGSPSAKSS